MTDTLHNDAFDEVVNRFSTAERSLGTLLDAAETFQDVNARLGEVQQSFERSEQSLLDTSSAVHGFGSELKGAARDLKDIAIYFRSLDPGELNRTVEVLVETNTKVVDTSTALAATVDRTTSAVEDMERSIEALQARLRWNLAINIVSVTVLGAIGAVALFL